MAEKKSQTAKREEEILKFWRENSIFEKSLEKDSPKGEYVFYDGPPFATGLPHYGSLLSSVIKDVIPRYKTMRGYHVRRRWGWDCHGLPIENIVEKELGFKSKKDIFTFGVREFNEACRESVLRYANDWKRYIERIARWVEFDNSYKTMDTTYIESVWWGLKQIHEKGLLYEGRKVLLYCPRCETPLAKAEVAMDHSYREVTEEAVTVKLKVKNPEKHNLPENTYFLVWTTTPWTLPGNVALAIGSDFDYSLVQSESENFILATSLLQKNFDSFKEVKKLSPKELIGIEYEPLFEIPKARESGKRAFYVSDGYFVTTEEGTGVVHTAVIYGEDDYELGTRLDLPMTPLLDASGHFTGDAPEFIQGKYFKASEKFIKDDLEKRGLLFKKENHTHSYPHCHRCETELLYNAISSWFINIQKVKRELIEFNEKINWFPEHLKHGRFLHTLENAPDWTISRNRFWASPLPIWRSEKSGKVRVIGSVEELKKYTKHSGNTYIVMRHGKAKSNKESIISSDIHNPNEVTDEGKEGIYKRIPGLKKEKIDLIISSDFKRTRQTAEIVQKELGLPDNALIFDERIRELQAGDFEGKPWTEFHTAFDSIEERFRKHVRGAETYADAKKRVMDFLFEVEEKYKNKNILIVSHGLPIAMMHAGTEGLDIKTAAVRYGHKEYSYDYAEVRELPFLPFPHNENYELDLHRPYIDELELVDEDGSFLKRVPEVLDGWVESGSMPFAEYHYPFENKEQFEKRFPADFIAEYIAQTRTWFYYMHVMAAVLFNNVSFKNVVTTGNVLAEDGSKMSKSKGNYTDPLSNVDVFGADALRFYLMESVVMRAEDMRFSDDELREMHNRVVNILWNVLRFYSTYAKEYNGKHDPYKSSHILDRWILSRFEKTVTGVTECLEEYDTVRSSREIRDFITDLSTWYIRRSRERFKSKNEEDKQYALATTEYVLRELSKVIAPFMPFLSESVYQGTRHEKESVHLENWPKLSRKTGSDKEILEDMVHVRRVVSLVLEVRMKAGVKVRQPLALLKIKSKITRLKDREELLQLIKDEVNVKEIIFEEKIEDDVELDTKITPELREEGNIRELIRHIQELRKKESLAPEEEVGLVVETGKDGRVLIEKFMEQIKETVLAKGISFAPVDGAEISIDGIVYSVMLRK